MRYVLNSLAATFLLILLLTAQLYPASPLFWVASLEPAFTVLRYVLVFVLFWFIVHPPKSKILRVPLGFGTLVLTAWLADTTYQGSMGFIDFLTLATAAAALLTTLLESKPKDEEFASMRLLTAIFSWLADRVRIAFSWAYQFAWLLATDLDMVVGEYFQRLSNTTEITKPYAGSAVPTRSGDWTSNLRAGLTH